MSKPKKIKDVMPAPAHRSLTHLDHLLSTPKAGSHTDKRKKDNKNTSRKKYDSRKDGW